MINFLVCICVVWVITGCKSLDENRATFTLWNIDKAVTNPSMGEPITSIIVNKTKNTQRDGPVFGSLHHILGWNAEFLFPMIQTSKSLFLRSNWGNYCFNVSRIQVARAEFQRRCDGVTSWHTKRLRMRTYRRITYEDRCQIHALRKAGITQAEIGKVLGVSQGTVSRELSRNTGRPLSASAAHGAVPTGAGPAPAAQADTPCASRHRPQAAGRTLEPGADPLLVAGRGWGLPQP